MTDFYVRSVDFEYREDSDGRTLFGRIVPYNEPTDIVEINSETQTLDRYREQFLSHSFAAMVQGFKARGGNASKRSNVFVPLLIDHKDNFDAMVGHAIELEDRDDGAYGTFKLYDDDRITKIRSVLTESHTGLSVSFRDIKTPRTIDGIISRVQVAINHVAATPTPAYAGASIQSIRETSELITATPLLDEVTEWLAAQRAE